MDEKTPVETVINKQIDKHALHISLDFRRTNWKIQTYICVRMHVFSKTDRQKRTHTSVLARVYILSYIQTDWQTYIKKEAHTCIYKQKTNI